MSIQAPPAAARLTNRQTLRLPRFAKTPEGVIGVALLLLVIGVAVIGPFVEPHPIDAPIGSPGQPPDALAPLGTDFLGRDVLSRLLGGGRSVLGLAAAATFLTYLIGGTVGMVAGYTRSWIDQVLMRSIDVVLTFPALLLMLVLITGAGNGSAVLLIGIVLVLFPGVARIVRTATLEVSTKGFVEAAVVRGDRSFGVMVREILPNITSAIFADLGIRFSGAIILAASVNFLGLGLQPPAANWGLMITENRPILPTNIWSMLAPAIMLAVLTISVNLIGDGYVRTQGGSRS
jgi:peptide/nickel transport system permease protein